MKAIAAWLICCVIWGTTWFFIKVGLRDLPPFSFAAMRFVVAVAVIFPLLLVLKIPMPNFRRDWRAIFVPGILTFGINYALVFWGETQISSGLAAVLQATIPIFGIIFAQFLLTNEKPTVRKLAAIVLGLLGVTAIFYEQLQLSGWLALIGSAALVLSAASAAYANVLVKSHAAEIHPASLLAGQMLVGLAPISIFASVIDGNPFQFNWTWQAVICILYLAIVGSILAFWLYYWVISVMEATKAMMIAFVTPVIAVIVGAAFLNETLPHQTAIGGILVLGSVALVLFRSKKERAEIKRLKELTAL